MNTEDVVFLHLGTRFPKQLAAAIGGIPEQRIEPLPLDLPIIRRIQADFAVKVLRAKPAYVLHVEHWSVRRPLSLTALYHACYHDMTQLPVRTVIVTTHRRLANAVPPAYKHGLPGDKPTVTPLRVVHLWRIKARAVLASRCIALYPFVPVMRDGRSARVLLSDLRECIMRDAPTEKDREDLLAAACYVALKSFRKGVVESVFGGIAQMAKSDVGQTLIRQGEEAGIERGRKEGLQVGRKEGLQIGQVQVRRETLLALMRAKFGAVPLRVARKVAAIEDVRRLDTLLRRILTATSLQEMGL